MPGLATLRRKHQCQRQRRGKGRLDNHEEVTNNGVDKDGDDVSGLVIWRMMEQVD